MKTPRHGESGDTAVSRRRLLALAGTAGLAAAIGACSQRPHPTSRATLEGVPETVPTRGATAVATPSDVLPRPIESVAPVGVRAHQLCRDAWGAQPAQVGGIGHTITRMTVHHTGAVLGDNRNAPARLRQHQRLHQNERGWIDIAYHVGVDRNGNIYELRDPELVGDTATDYDPTGHFLVLCEGDFDQEVVTAEQLHGAAMAFAWAAQIFTVSPATLAGHRDYASTVCPGANLYAAVSSGELRRRVNELLAAGVVDLQPICGPEAAERVAAIEAGA